MFSWINVFPFLITCLELLHLHLFLVQDPKPCNLDHSGCSPLTTLALLLLLAKFSAAPIPDLSPIKPRSLAPKCPISLISSYLDYDT